MSYEVFDPTGWIEPDKPEPLHESIESWRYLTGDEALMAVVTQGQSLFKEPTAPLFKQSLDPDTMDRKYRKRQARLTILRELEGENYITNIQVFEPNIILRGLSRIMGRERPAIATIDQSTRPTKLEAYGISLLSDDEFS